MDDRSLLALLLGGGGWSWKCHCRTHQEGHWTSSPLQQGLNQPCVPFSEPPLLFHLPTESSPSDPSMSTPSSYPTLSEVFGRKRKKRTSIETNIRLTLEKRFQDVSGLFRGEAGGPTSTAAWAGSHRPLDTNPSPPYTCPGKGLESKDTLHPQVFEAALHLRFQELFLHWPFLPWHLFGAHCLSHWEI